MSSFKLTYFDGRGRAENARMLFALASVDFIDERIKDDWPTVKPTTLFGQLPELEVDGTKIAQSRTIERFLARKFGYAGKSELEQAQVEMVVDTVEDLLLKLIKVFTEKDETKKEEVKKSVLEEGLPSILENLEKYLKSNKGGDSYFVGDSLTVADVAFVNGMTWIPLIMGTNYEMSAYPKLNSLSERVFSHPKITEWIAKRPETW